MAVVTRVNTRGIPCIKTIGAAADSTKLTLTFAPHANVSDFFQGLFLVYITSIPSASAIPYIRYLVVLY